MDCDPHNVHYNSVDISEPNHYKKPRAKLPAKMPPKDEMSLWSMLVKNAGKELSKISMPVEMNEPLSFLQRVAENMDYVELIHLADVAENALRRFEYVVAFVISLASANYKRLCKPFNPLLGETFELDRRSPNLGGYHLVCEQVKHHPPISAFHVDGGDVFRYWGALCPKTGFSGKNLQITIKGHMNLELLRHKETYTWQSVPCFLQNLIVGEPVMETIGIQNIICEGGPYRCQLKWKGSGTFTGRDAHCVKGYIYEDLNAPPIRVIKGRWCDNIVASHPLPNEKKKMFRKEDEGLFNGAFQRFSNLNIFASTSLPAKTRHSSEVDAKKKACDPSLESNERFLWQMNPRPPGSDCYYNFTYFALSLNEYPSSDEMRQYPPTDSRFRGDIRLLEEGNLTAAAKEKLRLEANQREREQKKQKSENPKWFFPKANPITGESSWTFNPAYYKRDWSECVRIFD